MQECSARVELETIARANNYEAASKSTETHSVLESGDDQETVLTESAIPEQSKDKAHCFCPQLAKEFGEESAVILQGLGYKVAKSKKVHDGKRWHYDTLETFEKERWPYLSDSGIGGILDRHAEAGRVFKGRYNKWTLDRTNWYSMRDDLVKRAMEGKGKIWFDVLVAIQCHSIIAGTLYQNIRYQLLLFLAENPGFNEVPYHKVNKAALARVLPWSLSTIKRELNKLVEHGLIAKNPLCSKEYTVCNAADLTVPVSMRKFDRSPAKQVGFRNGPSTEMGNGSFMEMTGSCAETIGSSTEKNGSSTDDNTHYETIEKTIHKHHSPHAARAVCGENENAADAAMASVHQDIGYQPHSNTVSVLENSDGILVPRHKPQSLVQLRHQLEVLTPQLTDKEKNDIKRWALGLALELVRGDIKPSILQACITATSADYILSQVIVPTFQAVEQHGISSGWNQHSRDVCFLRALDIVVGALLLHAGDEKVLERQFEARWNSVIETYNATPLPGNHPEATAEDKAVSFIAELNRCNKDGWPTYKSGDIQFTVSASAKIREAAEDFFESQPHLSTEDVWRILSDCVEVHALKPKPKGFDPLWKTRNGVKPAFLFTYWNEINAEIDAARPIAA